MSVCPLSQLRAEPRELRDLWNLARRQASFLVIFLSTGRKDLKCESAPNFRSASFPLDRLVNVSSISPFFHGHITRTRLDPLQSHVHRTWIPNYKVGTATCLSLGSVCRVTSNICGGTLRHLLKKARRVAPTHPCVDTAYSGDPSLGIRCCREVASAATKTHLVLVITTTRGLCNNGVTFAAAARFAPHVHAV